MRSVIFGIGNNDTPSTSVTEYTLINNANQNWETTESTQNIIVPFKMSIRDFRVSTGNTAPGSGKSYAFTLRKNGVDTALAATIADLNKDASDLSDVIYFEPGDVVALKCVPSGTPTAVGVFWTFVCETIGVDAQPIMLSTPFATLNNTLTQHFSVQNINTSTSGFYAVNTIMPTSGYFSNLSSTYSAAPGSGKSWQLELQKNAVATSLTLTVSDAATTATDNTNVVRVEKGDQVAFRHVPTGSPTTAKLSVGMLFTPDVPGESYVMMNGGSAPNASAVSWQYAMGSYTSVSPGFTANEAFFYTHRFPASAITSFYSAANTSPGTSKSVNFMLRKNSTDTAASLTYADADTSKSLPSINVPIAAGDYINMQATPSGTPANLFTTWSFALRIADSKTNSIGGIL